MRRILALLLGLCIGLLCIGVPGRLPPAVAQPLPDGVVDHFFLTSDGVRLHYLEAGPANAQTLVFVPGWAMPAWIWMPQILAFSRHYRVIALDPRGQGDSAVPATGYEPLRRGQDIADLVRLIGAPQVVMVGWSLGVLDTLAYIHVAGDRALAGLVLVDNSVGEEPAPAPVRVAATRPARPLRHAAAMRAVAMREFVRGMFRNPPADGYLARLTEATLHLPEPAGRLLRSYPMPRSFWKDAVYSTNVPLLYVVRPHWVAQGENLVRNRPATEMEVFEHAGHALFVDEPVRFNSVTDQFIRRWIWP
ncbi:MAG TPA: alpha/beta hydrolase [Rhodopila sp.]|nr:alpha/beta hydrolase [Rhodopila sp.]